MAGRFQLPQEAVYDSSGDPLSGAKLNFYKTQTTERLDTFSDDTLSTANANPVVADSSGRFGDIFLKPQDYKVVLTDADDVQIWTADPVRPGPFSTAVLSKSANYTATVGDYGRLIVVDASGGNRIVDLPAEADAGDGYKLTVLKSDSTDNTVTIDADDGTDIIVMNRQNQAATVWTDGTSWYVAGLGYDNPVGETASEQDFEDVASSGTTDIGGATSQHVRITGTTTITAFGTAPAGTRRFVRFAGSLTLTHNGTSLILPGTSNITTATDDTADFISLGSGNWLCMNYKRADGNALGTTGGLPRAYLAGLQLSNGTDSAHDIDIAVGECRDNANGSDLSLAATMTKQIDANWASGDAAGGFPSALTLSADTWYHVFVVDDSNGDTDAGFDTSTSATNLLSDTGGSAFRRIGSVLTNGSSNIIGFSQEGDHFLWDDPPLDVNVTDLGTSATLYALSVPTGVKVWVDFIAQGSGGETKSIYFSSPDANDEAPADGTAPLASMRPDLVLQNEFRRRTNTSSQIRARSDAADTDIDIATLGWIDRRGRDD